MKLADPDWYLGADVHETFTELRRTDPVHWTEMDGEPGFWAVLRHADAVHVSRHPEIFSSSLGGVLLEDPDEATLETTRRMLLVMDPPRHSAHRRPLAPHFGVRTMAEMEPRVRARIRALLLEGEVDLCHEVAAPLVSETMAEMMGLPPEDAPRIRQWSELALGVQDDEVAGAYAGSAAMDMVVYAMELAARRRTEPRRDDVTALLLDTIDDDAEFGSFFFQLVAAGNDTTRTLISSGVDVLLDHPDQLQALRDDPSLIATAIEEMLRYCNPVHYQRRTAVADAELGGVPIAAGDKVAVLYTSANRDEAVFADPQTFDVLRSPNPHLSFGIGAHFCLGAHVARLQARLFFEELLAAWVVERTAEPTRLRSNLTNGYRRLPVRLGKEGRCAPGR